MRSEWADEMCVYCRCCCQWMLMLWLAPSCWWSSVVDLLTSSSTVILLAALNDSPNVHLLSPAGSSLWWADLSSTDAYYLHQRKEVMFLVRSVCLSVCQITEKVVNGFWRNFLEGRAWPMDQWVQFWWQSGSPSGSRSPKSKIRIHWIIELPTDFDEILRRAGVWPRDQLIITFWWRSASLSGSVSPFRITIRIREELPQSYYAGIWRRSVLSLSTSSCVICSFILWTQTNPIVDTWPQLEQLGS